jgi:hypothetical protein
MLIAGATPSIAEIRKPVVAIVSITHTKTRPLLRWTAAPFDA